MDHPLQLLHWIAFSFEVDGPPLSFQLVHLRYRFLAYLVVVLFSRSAQLLQTLSKLKLQFVYFFKMSLENSLQLHHEIFEISDLRVSTERNLFRSAKKLSCRDDFMPSPVLSLTFAANE